MSRLSVLVTAHFLDAVQAEFEAAFDTTVVDTRAPAAAIAAAAKPFDAVLVSLNTPMQRPQIEALPAGVRALATYSVGTDHIDLPAARERGLAVFNTPGVLSDSVAENALFLMLGAARRATESIELVRSRSWGGWTPTQLVGTELAGKRLGVIGLGDIGQRVARRAQALGMSTLYCNRRPLAADNDLAAEFVATPEALVERCDVLLLAVPSNDETRGMIDAALLAHAKSGLILVNIARGDLVDDDALIAALREGRVLAAALDVFAGEPDIHPGYYELPNVFMLPHIGSSTIEARLRMGRILIDALTRWQAGEPVANRVC